MPFNVQILRAHVYLFVCNHFYIPTIHTFVYIYFMFSYITICKIYVLFLSSYQLRIDVILYLPKFLSCLLLRFLYLIFLYSNFLVQSNFKNSTKYWVHIFFATTIQGHFNLVFLKEH